MEGFEDVGFPAHTTTLFSERGTEIPGSISETAHSEPLDFGHNLFRFKACDALPFVALIQLQTQSMMLLMLPAIRTSVDTVTPRRRAATMEEADRMEEA